ncbi:MAG: hypothetical protein ACXWLF_03425 [Myxococcaceae bacterium]
MKARGLGRTLLRLVLFALLAGCAHQSYEPAPAHVQPPAGQWTFEDCELADDGSTVPSDFPRGSLAPPGAPEHAFGCALSAQLAALGEPALFPLPPSGEVTRVLWIRSGGHPVSVRFERQASAGQIRGGQTAGKGLAAPGELLEETSNPVSAEEVTTLLARIEAARLWGPAPPASAVPPANTASIWVFEAARAGGYQTRVFQRETLARDAGFNALARALVAASGLHVEGAVY